MAAPGRYTPDIQARAGGILEAYGDKIGPDFANRLVEVADDLEIDPMILANQIDTETRGTFDPAQPNLAGSGAVGLIQFMPKTAARLLNEAGFVGFEPTVRGKRQVWSRKQQDEAEEAFKNMDSDMQLHFVRSYLMPYKGRMKTAGDLGMAVFFPRALGKGRDYDIEDWYRRNAPSSLERFKRQNKGIRTAGDYMDLVEKRARHTRRRLGIPGGWVMKHGPGSEEEGGGSEDVLIEGMSENPYFETLPIRPGQAGGRPETLPIRPGQTGGRIELLTSGEGSGTQIISPKGSSGRYEFDPSTGTIRLLPSE